MQPQYTQLPTPPKKNRVPRWVWIALPIFVIVMCCGGIAAMMDTSKAKDTTTQQTVAPQVEPEQTAEVPPPPPPARVGVDVDGSNASVKQLGATLNGTYQVDYTGSSVCIIVEFKKADGSDGAGFMQMINDCGSSATAKISGSTLVTLSDVTMIQVSNTRGAWKVTFVPVG